jgi:prevent-host-death family protein
MKSEMEAEKPMHAIIVIRYDHVCYNLSMKKIAAGEFKARCLALMEDVRSTREPLVITKRGKPVAKLVPVGGARKTHWIGRLNGKMRIVGDIESPVVPLEDWEACGDSARHSRSGLGGG